MIKSFGYVLCLGLVFILFGCSKIPETIKIGVVLNLSGKAADEGIECRNAYRLAADEINSLGGINGCKVELIVRDNAGTKEKSEKVTRELIHSGIKFILGYVASHECWSALQEANSHNVLLISPSVTGEKFFGLEDNLISLLAHNKYQSEILSKAAFDRIGNSVYTLISDRNKEEFSLSLINQFKNYLNAYGVEKLYIHSLDNSDNRSMDSIIIMIKKEKPKALMVALSAVDLGLLIQKVKKINPKVLVYSPMWGLQPLLVESGGNCINDGIYFAGVFNLNNKNENYLNFRNKYKTQFKTEPTAFSMLGYESMMLLKDAMLKEGSDSPNKVKSYICNISNYEGLQTRFGFNQSGDPDRKYSVFTIKNNQFIKVEDANNN